MMKVFKNIVTTSSCIFTLSMAQAATVAINNPSFESDWSGWTDSDPSALSSDAYSGSKSAKITGSGGAFEQVVSVSANTDYTLTAWIFGKGTIGANVGSATASSSANTSNWEEKVVTFNSGSNTTATIFGLYNGGDGRFDFFSLESSDGGGTGPCTESASLSISSASDNGSNDGHGPELTIDNNLANESRWSSSGTKSIVYDLGESNEVTELEVAFYNGDPRNYYFYVETSIDGSNWTSVLENAVSSGTSDSLELFDVTDSTARYVRLTGNGNSVNPWNSILETNILGCGDLDIIVDPELNPNLAPSENFDLTDWYLSIPTDTDGNNKADSIKEDALNDDYQNSNYFYTGSDGGMVFKITIDGYKTSPSTPYTRTELREMLRRGDTNIETSGVNKNNWVFSSAPSSAQNEAGRVDGTLSATVAVNHVSTTGDSDQVGRVIIGQIHANDDEPARLYYRKLPGNSKGSLYLAHEPNGGSDIWYEIIGTRSDNASNPSDGIALNEKFSYEIKVVGNDMWVTIQRDNKPDEVQYVDMSNSGYDVSDQYMYFKAGVYIQDNTGDDSDYAQATFYKLENTHDGYDD